MRIFCNFDIRQLGYISNVECLTTQRSRARPPAGVQRNQDGANQRGLRGEGQARCGGGEPVVRGPQPGSGVNTRARISEGYSGVWSHPCVGCGIRLYQRHCFLFLYLFYIVGILGAATATTPARAGGFSERSRLRSFLHGGYFSIDRTGRGLIASNV